MNQKHTSEGPLSARSGCSRKRYSITRPAHGSNNSAIGRGTGAAQEC